MEYPSMSIFEAASVSFRQIHKHWCQVFLLWIVMALLGLFVVTTPYLIIVSCVAFKHIIGMQEHYIHVASV